MTILNLKIEYYYINKVKEYQWVDHHAPPLKLLFEICYEMHQYLKGYNFLHRECRKCGSYKL